MTSWLISKFPLLLYVNFRETSAKRTNWAKSRRFGHIRTIGSFNCRDKLISHNKFMSACISWIETRESRIPFNVNQCKHSRNIKLFQSRKNRRKRERRACLPKSAIFVGAWGWIPHLFPSLPYASWRLERFKKAPPRYDFLRQTPSCSLQLTHTATLPHTLVPWMSMECIKKLNFALSLSLSLSAMVEFYSRAFG